MDLIDFRSDTVTKPTPAMRNAMALAPVGDDVYGEDPTVNALEADVAQLLNTEAAVFVPSGTQSNLCAILAHCQRGDEYLVGQRAHTYKYEAGGAAVLGSIQPQPVEMNPDGTMDLDVLAGYIKPEPNMNHFARSRLLALENTSDGHVLPMDYVRAAQEVARNHGLGLHLDGARLFNAAVAQGVEPAEIARGFDTVSVCLSKGLGAPVGSVLAGSGELLEEARRWRKMLGGGMRQAGVLAAAGSFALANHVTRLAADHALASEVASAVEDIDGVELNQQATNMVFVSIPGLEPAHVVEQLAKDGIVMRGGPEYRMVTHLDLPQDTVSRTERALRRVLKGE